MDGFYHPGDLPHLVSPFLLLRRTQLPGSEHLAMRERLLCITNFCSLLLQCSKDKMSWHKEPNTGQHAWRSQAAPQHVAVWMSLQEWLQIHCLQSGSLLTDTVWCLGGTDADKTGEILLEFEINIFFLILKIFFIFPSKIHCGMRKWAISSCPKALVDGRCSAYFRLLLS